MNSNSFFSCDWGTTHFRLRLVDTSDGSCLREVQTAEGVGVLAKDYPDQQNRAQRYEEVLLGHMAALQQDSAPEWCIVSGMGSSRIGWKELPYASLPISLDGAGLVHETLALRGGIAAVLISGLRDEADVIRGEEVEIIGLADLLPALKAGDSVVVMPGTHSKHVHLNGGKIVSFKTLMTGELFAHLHSAPTLQMCLAKGKFDANDAWFLRGVKEALSVGLAASLFKIRSRSLLHGVSGPENSAFLSGLLIGTELLQLPQNTPVHLAAGESLGVLYLRAAQELGIAIEPITSETLKQATVAAHRQLLQSVAGF